MFWKRKRSDRDFAEEVRAHLRLEADELNREGMPATDAEAAARRAFGNVTAAEERFYERHRLLWLDDLLRDIRYALRTMRRSPGFTAGTALLLALGIGANTAIYSFVEAVLLRSLPVRDPGALVLFKWRARDNPPVKRSISGEAHMDPALGYVSGNFPYPAFERLAANQQVLSTAFGFYGLGGATVLANESAEAAETLFVTGRFFDGLGIPPALGRVIGPHDDREGAPGVAVLSHAYWKGRFGEDRGVVGKTIAVNDKPFQVIGVAQAGFFGVNSGGNVHVYLPIRYLQSTRTQFQGNPNSMYRADHWYWVNIMARLQPGVSRQQADAALSASFGAWVAGTAESEKERAMLPMLYLQDGASGMDFIRVSFSKPLFLLMALAGLILAIACANVANLLMSRAASRRREIALRLGLGAGGSRVARQLFTESLMLAVAGGLLGVLFAWAGMRGLSALAGIWQPDTTFRTEVNWSFLMVTGMLATITGLLFGLAPAIQAWRLQLAPGLKQARLGRAGTVKSGLVALQIAISLVLLAAASLFVRTVSNLQSVSLGFNPDHLLLLNVDPRQAGYKGEAMTRYFTQATDRLRTIPGVQSATLTSYPLAAGNRSGTGITIPGISDTTLPVAIMWVGPDFFSTMQIPMPLGRDFSEHDASAGPMAAVVNEAFAARYLPGRNPIGEILQFGPPDNFPAAIVGVARDTPLYSLRKAAEPIVFAPHSQHPVLVSGMTFVLRIANHTLPIAGAARQILGSLDARIPVTNVRTQTGAIHQTFGQERLFAYLCSAFAILALVIASVGLYATLAYGVSRRTGEIGVRIALGARRGQVIRMILRESLPMVLAGLAIGAVLVWTSARLIESYLFGMQPADPASLSRAVITLVIAAAIAGFLPAWRASRVDPMESLRHE